MIHKENESFSGFTPLSPSLSFDIHDLLMVYLFVPKPIPSLYLLNCKDTSPSPAELLTVFIYRCWKPNLSFYLRWIMELLLVFVLSVSSRSSLPVADGTGELRASEGVLPESAAQGGQELQGSVPLRRGLLPPRRLPEGSALPEGVAQTGTVRSARSPCVVSVFSCRDKHAQINWPDGSLGRWSLFDSVCWTGSHPFAISLADLLRNLTMAVI